jgi:hypothetical protein
MQKHKITIKTNMRDQRAHQSAQLRALDSNSTATNAPDLPKLLKTMHNITACTTCQILVSCIGPVLASNFSKNSRNPLSSPKGGEIPYQLFRSSEGFGKFPCACQTFSADNQFKTKQETEVQANFLQPSHQQQSG